MITMYYVDLFNKHTDEMEFTILRTDNYNKARETKDSFNTLNDDMNYYADIIEIEEETTMKKYELKDYKEFCRKALTSPPFEEFDSDTSDEEDWFDTHKIKIVTGEHEIELPYAADVVNEVEDALREMYEAIEGDGEATTGNTFGSEYRQAELKDVVRYFIMYRYENSNSVNWFKYAKQAVEELSDIAGVLNTYEEAREYEKEIEFKCNWHNFKMDSLRDATKEGIKKIILDWVGSDIEISYDPTTDKSFIIDYTFKESGEFVEWSWGDVNKEEIRILIEGYKSKIFED